LQDGSCNIIAEVKCASPSRGRLIEDFNPVRIAGIYEKTALPRFLYSPMKNILPDIKII